MESHETQAILRTPSLLSHQKLVNADWIFFVRDLGSLKQVIAWEGMGVRALRSIVIFPAVDRNLLDHPTAFILILSTIDVKRSLFLLPKCSGSPKYLPTLPSLCIDKIPFITSLSSVGVFLEKEMEDLSTFI